jgi:hypothetical protein
MEAATITVLCTSVLTLVGVILNYLREGRAHQWQMDQSARDQAERLRVAKDLKTHTLVTSEALSGKIDENTAVSVAAFAVGEKAFNEANNLTAKIRAEGLQLREPSRRDDRPGGG